MKDNGGFQGFTNLTALVLTVNTTTVAATKHDRLNKKTFHLWQFDEKSSRKTIPRTFEFLQDIYTHRSSPPQYLSIHSSGVNLCRSRAIL